jgi:hypothetical protein
MENLMILLSFILLTALAASALFLSGLMAYHISMYLVYKIRQRQHDILSPKLRKELRHVRR